jgi:hypothetical protein
VTAAAGMAVGAVGVGRNATVVLMTPEEIGEVSKKNTRAHGPPAPDDVADRQYEISSPAARCETSLWGL